MGCSVLLRVGKRRYADRGAKAISEAFATTGRETDSPFEDSVMKALEHTGQLFADDWVGAIELVRWCRR